MSFVSVWLSVFFQIIYYFEISILFWRLSINDAGK